MNTLQPISNRGGAAWSRRGRWLFSNKLECSVSAAATGDAALGSRETVGPGLQFRRCIFYFIFFSCDDCALQSSRWKPGTLAKTRYVNRVVPSTSICCNLYLPSYWMSYTPATTNQCNLFAWVQRSFGNLFPTTTKVSSRKQEPGDSPTDSLKFFKRSKRPLHGAGLFGGERQNCREEMTSSACMTTPEIIRGKSERVH